MQEKVYIVPGKEHLRRAWPELLNTPQPFDPDCVPEERLAAGVDCWLMNTWARLCVASPPFEPVLAGHAPAGSVCLFHYDTALPHLGVHRCFSVVIQADRPQPALADMVIFQNTTFPETACRQNIPLWPQPGLIPRDSTRNDAILNMVYLGSMQYVPEFINDPDFQDGLRALNVNFECRFRGGWHDYRDVDLVLAIRNSPSVVLATKPASKLTNAWLAGSPALLGPEPGYQCLRQSPLDYLEVHKGRDVLDAVAKLKADPALYAAMRANGTQRGKAFTVQAVTRKWIETLNLALQRNSTMAQRHPLPRLAAYKVMRQVRVVQAKLAGWKD